MPWCYFQRFKKKKGYRYYIDKKGQLCAVKLKG